MKWTFWVAVLLLVVSPAFAQQKRILLMRPAAATHFQKAFDAITGQAGLWTVDVNTTGTGFDLANYDVVLTYDCQPGPAIVYSNDAGGATLLDWISNGGALVAFHSGFLNRSYIRYVGGERQGHPWSFGVPFTNNAPDHPIMQEWPLEFRYNEEIFDWNLTDTRLFPEYFHLLFSVDMAKASPKVNHGVPVAGCAEHGQGRIYFNHWGHNASTFEISSVKDHVVKAIRWVTKMDGDSPTKPNPEYTEFEDVKAFVAFHADRAGMDQASFASFYGLTAGTHPDLAATHVETVAALRRGQGSIADYLKSLANKVFESVSITAPLNGATYAAPAAITINAKASGTVSKVEFHCQGGMKLGEDTSSPYSYTWNDVPGGSHTLTARVTDDGGETTVSPGVNITVTSPLTVSIISPTDEANFLPGSSISITAHPVDTAGKVTKVEFYQGSTKLGEATSKPWTYTWSNVAIAGAYSLSAVATDDGGLQSTADAVSITVGDRKLTGTVIGTSGSYQNDPSYTREKAFDGKTGTFFDSGEGRSWCGLDLGSDNVVTKIRYYPREGFESRMTGGKFQGSSTADFSSGVVDLYTVSSQPPLAWTETAEIESSKGFRYVRLTGCGYGNVAEVEFYGYVPSRGRR